ncbi:MAG TPA: hypothetical protein VNS63_16360 [Blastocatellia bacterium]|nr:hypothetical protein [Blastocatellia bacterium]
MDQQGRSWIMEVNQNMSDQSTRDNSLNKRLEEIGWGLFLILIGVILLVPDVQAPQGIWLLAAALILLGLNAFRYLNGIKMSGFTISLGVLALAAGLGSIFGMKLPLFAILLVLVGASVIFKQLFAKKITSR